MRPAGAEGGRWNQTRVSTEQSSQERKHKRDFTSSEDPAAHLDHIHSLWLFHITWKALQLILDRVKSSTLKGFWESGAHWEFWPENPLQKSPWLDSSSVSDPTAPLWNMIISAHCSCFMTSPQSLSIPGSPRHRAQGASWWETWPLWCSSPVESTQHVYDESSHCSWSVKWPRPSQGSRKWYSCWHLDGTVQMVSGTRQLPQSPYTS